MQQDLLCLTIPGWLRDQIPTCSEFSMTSAMRSAALNFSFVPKEPHLPSPLSFRSSFSWLPLDFSGSCCH